MEAVMLVTELMSTSWDRDDEEDEDGEEEEEEEEEVERSKRTETYCRR
jgi:hypothetical protein